MNNNSNVATDPNTFLGHPRGLATLFFTEMWERFSYYGMRALLVLFLVDAVQRGGFGLTDREATAIYGLYTAAAYLSSLPGGWIADRIIGAQRAIWWGALIILTGHIVLGISASPAVFYVGLVIVVVGTGLLKPNIGAIVAELYPEGGARRDAGYTIYYFGVNFGATIGQIVTAWLASRVSWSAGFFAAAVGMALGLVQFTLTRKSLGGAGERPYVPNTPDGQQQLDRYWRVMWGVAAALVVVVALFFFGVISIDPRSFAQSAASGILILAQLTFAYLLLFAGLQGVQVRRVFLIMVLFAASALFWSGFEQAGSSFNLFASRYTDRIVDAFSFEIPAGWFQSVNTFWILVCAPLFAGLWSALGTRNRDISSTSKMALGLLFLAAGFVVMAGASRYVAEGMKVAPMWLITTYLLHTFGELSLSPIGMSAFTKLVPTRLVGTILGLWFLSISLGNLVAGLIAGEFDAENLVTMPGQFMAIVRTAMIPAVALLVLVFITKRVDLFGERVADGGGGDLTPSVARPWPIAAYCGLGLLSSVILYCAVFMPQIERVGAWYPPYVSLLATINFVCMVGLWRMRRWAAQVWLALAAINLALLFSLGLGAAAMLIAPALFLLVVAPNYAKLR